MTERTSEIENLEEERDSLKQALCKSEVSILLYTKWCMIRILYTYARTYA